MKKIIECVPNFSEGRNNHKIEKIIRAFKNKDNVKLLDCQQDKDHNRMVVTIVGEPKAVTFSVVESIRIAVDIIDMRKHQGQHPRMGAVDVVPFIPVKEMNMQDAIKLSKDVAKKVADKCDLPVFLYEASASRDHCQNLSEIRKGQFEGMDEKLKSQKWRPDFGPSQKHPTAGVTAIGARMPLIAFNVNLDTDNLNIAKKIAKKIRFSSGGLPFCKAIGIDLKDKGMVQVSMNMTDYTQTGLFESFNQIKKEADKHGVRVCGSEIVGLVPMAALMNTAEHYLGLQGFSMEQILEARIME